MAVLATLVHSQQSFTDLDRGQVIDLIATEI